MLGKFLVKKLHRTKMEEAKEEEGNILPLLYLVHQSICVLIGCRITWRVTWWLYSCQHLRGQPERCRTFNLISNLQLFYVGAFQWNPDGNYVRKATLDTYNFNTKPPFDKQSMPYNRAFQNTAFLKKIDKSSTVCQGQGFSMKPRWKLSQKGNFRCL